MAGIAELRRSRFESVVLPHLDAAYSLGRPLTRNDADADAADVVQEAMLRAFRYFDSYREGDAKAGCCGSCNAPGTVGSNATGRLISYRSRRKRNSTSRLDLIAGRPVPALVYRRHAHVINLYVLPASRRDLPATIARNGYTLLHWCSGDLGFWAVWDATASELGEFERVSRAATGG